MLVFSVPPGYRRSRPPARPKLGPFVGIIDRILEDDKGRPAKQRHTSKRIFERLRAEHGYGGGLTIVKDYVLLQRQRQREMFVPLRHDPGPEPVCRPFALDVEGRIPAAFQDEVRLVTSGTVRRATGLLTQEMVPDTI